jgi:hypothetical protein
MRPMTIQPGGVAAAVRWTARFLATFFVMLLLLTLFGAVMEHRFPPRLSAVALTSVESMSMVLLVVVACVGMAIGWRWELAGGVLTTGATLLAYVTEFIVARRPPPGFMFVLMLFTGILFLLSSLWSKDVAAPPRSAHQAAH